MKITSQHKNVIMVGWLLAITALLGTTLMVIVNWHSEPFIAYNEREILLRGLNAVIPAGTYDNDILNDTLQVTDMQLLGSAEPRTIYRARNAGKPVSAVLSVTAPKGYSGPIELLIGINYAGEIMGVRVVKHRETPGLGDAIEIQRSNWITGFNGKSRSNPSVDGWKVKRDGGQFDQFTGATITPRAIVSSVHNALVYFEQNRDRIFSISGSSDSSQSTE